MNRHEHNVATLYDRLLRFERQSTADLTVHKKLHFPAAWRADGIHDINDWLKQNLEISAETDVLDAGCGVGGTLFALLADGGRGLGITLSGQQVTVAEQIAAQRGVSDRIRFVQQSYDGPLNRRFDIIVTIEALLHSADLGLSIANLARGLKRNGRLVLIEEMRAESGDQPLVRLLRDAWQLASLYCEADYHAAINSADLHLIAHHDFTPYVRAKRWPTAMLTAAWRLLNRLPGRRGDLLRIYLGGLALEALYAGRQMRYRVWIVGDGA